MSDRPVDPSVSEEAESSDDRAADQLLRSVGRFQRQAREQEGTNAAERMAAGQLSAQAAARQGGVAAHPSASEALTPWSKEQQQALAAQMLGLVNGSDDERATETRAPTVGQAYADKTVVPVDAAARNQNTKRQNKGAARVRRLVVAAIPALAAAAAAALWLAPSGGAPLPDYALHGTSGDALLRSGAGALPPHAAPRLRADSLLELRMQPAEPVSGSVTAQLWVKGESEAGYERTPAKPQIATSGAIRWRGAANVLLGGRTGPLELLVVVGRPDLVSATDAHPAPTADGVVQAQVQIHVEKQ